MVDVEFKSRATHFVPLSVLKSIVAGDTPECLTSEDVDVIKGHFAHVKACGLLLMHMHAQVWRFSIVGG